MNTYPDSDIQYYSKMVLCIEEYKNPEHEYNDANIDMRVYIYYNDNKYKIYGKRHETEKSIQKKNGPKYVPFYFECEKKKEMISFIKLITDVDTYVTIGLYNYNNMFNHDICYEFFEQQQDKYYEIVAFDYVTIHSKNITLNRAMNMIKAMNSGVVINDNWESYCTENITISDQNDLEPNDIVLCKEFDEMSEENIMDEASNSETPSQRNRRERRKRREMIREKQNSSNR